MFKPILLFLVISAHFILAQSESFACDKVVATAHPEYPPYHWQVDDQIVGASVDLNRIIFKELGVAFEAQYAGPWKRVLRHAKYGGVDFVMALKKTPEREKYLNYTDHYIFNNPFAVFTLKNKPFEFNDWNDLIGKKGGKNAGDRYGEPFDTFAKENLNLSDGYSMQVNAKKIIAGRIDYMVHGRYVGLAHFARIEGAENIKPLPQNINNGFIHSGFSKKSDCQKLLPYISKRYKELYEDGTAEHLLQKNIERWRKSFR